MQTVISIKQFCNENCSGLMLTSNGKLFGTLTKEHIEQNWTFSQKVRLPKYLGGVETHIVQKVQFSNNKRVLLKYVQEGNIIAMQPYKKEIEEYHMTRLAKQLSRLD
ncbi:MAG: hypothetical protein ACRCYT_01995 [Cetobacterium sp.]